MNDMRMAVEALYMPAKPKSGDPLGQRGYLCIKVGGGVHETVIEGDVHTAFAAIRDRITKQVEAALLSALQTPDTSARA